MGDYGPRVELEGAAKALVSANPIAIVEGRGHGQRGPSLGGRGIDLERPERRFLDLRKSLVWRQIAPFTLDVVGESHCGVGLGEIGIAGDRLLEILDAFLQTLLRPAVVVV